jgi:hypothetical protein
VRQTISTIANGALIYAIFHGVVGLLAVKGGLLSRAPVWGEGGPPELVAAILIPFIVSLLGSFMAQAGLRLTLKRLRLALAGSEASASIVFFVLVTIMSVLGMPKPVFSAVDPADPMVLAIVVGAGFGILWRRRIAL